MKQKNGGWIALFLAPACILFILIFAIPLVMVFVTSLAKWKFLTQVPFVHLLINGNKQTTLMSLSLQLTLAKKLMSS